MVTPSGAKTSMNMSSLALVPVAVLWRMFLPKPPSIILKRGNRADSSINSANLARAGHSVFLIEAGADRGEEPIQQVPALYVGFRSYPQSLSFTKFQLTGVVMPDSSAVSGAEDPDQVWSFFVEHYRNETQARRDLKYTYTHPNGSYYIGDDPPEGVEP